MLILNSIMKNKVFIICLSLWCVITLLRLFTHQPWSDEAWAWILTKEFHFGNILETIHVEGHFFVWYLMLLPFAKLNIAYPYSMLIINWLCCFGAIIVLWKYSNFNNFLKFIICLSFPFLSYYPIVARCYSVGILLLFLLCALYKDKLKHPVIYSILIFFCANTSVMALIGAFFFGLIFAYELIKEKKPKDLKICSCIGAFTILVLLVQIIGVSKSTLNPDKIVGLDLQNLLTPFIFSEWINAILLLVFGVIFFKALYKDKRSLIFLAGTYSLLLYIFNCWYLGDFWHYYFFYFYLIIACWIFLYNENIDIKSKKNVIICLTIISSFLIFDYRYEPRVFNSQSKVLASYVKEHKSDRQIFINSVFAMVLPYIDYKNYDLTIERKSENKDLTFDYIENLMNKEKDTYLYINNCKEIKDLTKDNKIITFKEEKNILNAYCIYKIALK